MQQPKITRGFARRDYRVLSIDPAEPLLNQARLLDAAKGILIDYRVGRAVEIDLPSESVEAVPAGQCWHWFERGRVPAEVARILRRDGSLVIAHFDWIPLAGNVVDVTERLIESHNPAWKWGGGLGLYP